MRGAWVAPALLVALLTSACATRASVSRTQVDIAAAYHEIKSLQVTDERVTRDLSRLGTELSAAHARVVALADQMSEVSATIVRLNARVDQTDTTVAQLKAALEQVRVQRVSATATPEDPRPPPPRPAPRADGPERAYAVALGLFQAGEHGQAVLDLLGFLARYPKHPLASNAQYWIGEAYYTQRDYRQAAAEFRKVLEQDPRGVKVPDALVKLGLCYASLRQGARAREYWQRTVREHPDSAAAGKARALLRADGAAAARSR